MNTPSLLRTAAITCLVLLCASTAVAQDGPEETIELKLPAARQGYYVGGGGGAMFNMNYRTEDDDTDLLQGGGGYIRFGEMITDWLGAGFYIGGGIAESDRYSTGFGGLLLDLQILPTDHLAIHVGVGGGGLSLTDNQSETDELDGTGGGYYMFGVSYDWFPLYENGTGGFSVTPTLQVHYLPGQIFDGTIFVVGFETLFWTGLPKNRLELSVEEAFTAEDN